jgi:hypothetical protein
MGKKDGLLEGMEVSLRIKFGEEGLQLLPQLRQLDDNDKLLAILKAIPTAKSLDDLRGLLS